MSLKSSISEFLKIDELKDNFLKLIDAKFELKKLEYQEKIEDVVSGLVVKILMASFLAMVFLFLNILGAIGINYLTDTSWAGYAIMALVYFVLWLIFNSQKPKVEQIVRNSIAKAMDETGL